MLAQPQGRVRNLSTGLAARSAPIGQAQAPLSLNLCREADMTKYYTGIGSRETPEPILALMQSAAYHLAGDGWILRSGCAPGADSAFEYGAWSAHQIDTAIVPRPELYLPWPKFEGRADEAVTRTEPQQEAYVLAAQFHPAWDRLTPGAKSLHARNVHQVLGPNVRQPVLSTFVVCWTRDGEGQGGTGQALRIARHYDVPVFDLAKTCDRERIERMLSA